MKFRLLEKIRKLKQSGKGNRGFSLVEILVAVAILSISIIPIAAIFVGTTKVTSKSRTKLQATLTADSVIEAAKANSVFMFDKQCRLPDGDSGFKLLTNSITEGFVGGTYAPIRVTYDGNNTLIAQNNGDKSGSFTKNADQYAFLIKGIKQSHSTYDAIIIFKKQEMQSIVAKDKKSSTATSAYMLDTVFYPSYNWEYKLTAFVFKHTDGLSYKDSANLLTDEQFGFITKIEGNKIDSAKPQN